MGDKSKIEWTNATWSPIRARNKVTGKIGWHCEHVTPGCEHCYSETLNMRLGTGLPFKPGHRKDVEIFLDETMLQKPLHWKRPRMVFVCSMTDLFAEFVPDEWIDRMISIMNRCPQHTFQMLTKRAKRMREFITEASMHPINGGWPLKNVWLGISAEDQERADNRIPHLLSTPAAVRFVSYEPALGPIDFGCIEPDDHGYIKSLNSSVGPNLNWIIYGGESGGNRRPSEIAWAESAMRQCKEAGTKFFFKQDSAFRSGMRGRASDELWACKEFPTPAATD